MSVSFLFGSGADTDACSSLPSGNSFAEALITNKYNKEVEELLKINASHFKMLYPTSSKIYIQTIYHNQEKAKKFLDNNDVDLCITYYNDKQSVKFDDIKILASRWYKAITNCESDSEKSIKDFFLENAVLFDVLDEKFNSLRYQPPNSNANRVMVAYASVFVLMLTILYDLQKDFVWSYDNVFAKLREEYTVKLKPNCYYDTLKQLQEEYFVITPNYTDLAQKITKKDVIYLHGKLNWFEDLTTLAVYDSITEQEQINLSNQIVPFIMIPSGVKPIICGKQISQFSNFMSALNESDRLCVVGYKFNSEDNHINSLIADWLKKENSQIIYFNFQTESDKGIQISELNWIDNSYTKASISFNDGEKIEIGSEKIISIDINSKNANEAFKRFISCINKGNNDGSI